MYPCSFSADHLVRVENLRPRPQPFATEARYRKGGLNDLCDEEIQIFDRHVIIHLAATFQRSAETSEFWDENYQHNIVLGPYVTSPVRKLASLRRVVFASSYLIYSPDVYYRGELAADAVSLK